MSKPHGPHAFTLKKIELAVRFIQKDGTLTRKEINKRLKRRFGTPLRWQYFDEVLKKAHKLGALTYKSGTTTGRISSKCSNIANLPTEFKPITAASKPPDEYTPTKDMANILSMLNMQMSIEGITEFNLDIDGNLNIEMTTRLHAKLP